MYQSTRKRRLWDGPQVHEDDWLWALRVRSRASVVRAWSRRRAQDHGPPVLWDKSWGHIEKNLYLPHLREFAPLDVLDVDNSLFVHAEGDSHEVASSAAVWRRAHHRVGDPEDPIPSHDDIFYA